MNFFHKIPIFFWSWFYPCTIYGKENIPKDGAAVLVCNHFRAIDCGFIARAYNKDIFFLAKKELFKNKLLGKIVKSFGAIPIDREKPELKSMLLATKVLKEGHKLAIFPEGKRNKENSTLQPIKGGAAVFAVKAKCPVVPMMIYKKSKAFRRTYVIIGKPFELDEFYNVRITSEETEKIDLIIRDKMLEQAEILDNMMKIKKKKNKNACN